MRGEQHNTQDQETEIINVKKFYPMAVVLNEKGQEVYFIKSTWWPNLIIILFIIILTISATLSVLTFTNSFKIDKLERNEVNTNTNR